jgi:hypothetical protein
MVTMLLGGLWHGAAWLFVIWGAWHGLLLAATHALRRSGLIAEQPTGANLWVRRQITFLLIVVGWVFFRAADVRGGYGPQSVAPAVGMLKEMVGLGPAVRPLTGVTLRGVEVPVGSPQVLWLLIAVSWVWCNFAPNSFDVAYNLRFNRRHALAAGAVMAVCVLHFGLKVDFLYFRF